MNIEKNSDVLEVEKKKKSILTPVLSGEPLIIGALSGEKHIAAAPEVFLSFISTDFWKWRIDKPGKRTEAVVCRPFDLIGNGEFEKIFSEFDQERLIFSQNQIVEFCRLFPEYILETDGTTFFPFVENNFPYIAAVKRFPDGLFVIPRSQRDDDIFCGDRYRYRIVIPETAIIKAL